MFSTGAIILRIIIFLGIMFLLDWYAFQGVKMLTMRFSPRTRWWIHFVFWLLNNGILLAVVLGFYGLRVNLITFPTLMKVMGWMLTLFLPKLLFITFLFGEDIVRLFIGLWNKIQSFFSDGPKEKYFPGRREFLSRIALGVAMIPAAGMIYGMWKGKYQYTVHREVLYFPDLPKNFDGFTITQVSDFHAGSFDNEEAVKKGIELAIKQKSDIYFFTGDLVNNIATEIIPFKEIFAAPTASFGKFSILGNHDYSDYIEWDSQQEKDQNLVDLKKHHADMGYRLLLNEATKIEKDGEYITLIGVENWGSGGFKKAGDLEKALRGVDKESFKILLSHDPSHWEGQVIDHPTHIHLTLSGHTHGMQFGIEVGGFKWSPVKYRYPQWAGLYEQNNKYIYVNRGFGFLGFPGRVGIWPEITVIELRRGHGTRTIQG
jgi:uncharacterized protein